MRRICAGAAACVALLAASAAPAGASGLPSPTNATSSPYAPAGAVQFDMVSVLAGRSYRVFVQRPSGAPPASGWPVLVATDGNAAFGSAAAAERIYELMGRKALVIGVGYPTEDIGVAMVARTRDLTPETPLAAIIRSPGQPPPKLEDYGGAEPFYRFLVEELRPRIAALYPVDASDQTLWGHSLGGLFTIGVLFAHPEAFRSYVASSPSLWWDGQAALKAEAAFARKVETGAVVPRVLVLVGAKEQTAPDGPPPPGVTPAELTRLVALSRMIDNATELGARLAALKGGPGYAAGVHVLDGEDHISVIPASLARALAFAEGAAP